MKKQSIGIGLMGLGVVAGEVARVLMSKTEVLAEQVGCPLVLRKVKVLAEDLVSPQALEMDSQLFTTDADEFFTEPGIDIVVEAIGGERPAVEYLERAISGGKYVVTSNKEVIAKHGAKLLASAQQHKLLSLGVNRSLAVDQFLGQIELELVEELLRDLVIQVALNRLLLVCLHPGTKVLF